MVEAKQHMEEYQEQDNQEEQQQVQIREGITPKENSGTGGQGIYKRKRNKNKWRSREKGRWRKLEGWRKRKQECKETGEWMYNRGTDEPLGKEEHKK